MKESKKKIEEILQKLVANNLSAEAEELKEMIEAIESENDPSSFLDRYEKRIGLQEKLQKCFLQYTGEKVFGELVSTLLIAFDSQVGFLGYINQQGDMECPSMMIEVWDRCEIKGKSIIFPTTVWGGSWGECLKSQKTIIKNTSHLLPDGHLPLHCSINVPILWRGSLLGLFSLANKEGGYGPRDRKKAESVAQYLAPILDQYLQKTIESEAREKLQQSLISNNELLSNLIQATPLPFVKLDLEGKVKEIWNPAAEHMLGWKREEVLGKVLPSVTEEKYPELLESINNIVSGKKEGFEVLRRKKDGSLIEYAVYGSPQKGSGGQVSGVLLNLVDLTEGNRAKKALIQERDRAQLYFDIADVMILVLNKKGIVTLINKKGCEVLGFSEKDIIGKNWFDHFVPEDIKTDMKERFDSIIKSEFREVSSGAENQIITAEGDRILISWRNAVFYDPDGEIHGIISSGHDITMERQAMQNLEERVKERTQKLEDAKIRAEENEKLKSAFLANMSHEIRTPLNAIMGFANLLREGEYSESRTRDFISMISNSGEQLLNLINDIIDFSKIESGRLETNIEDVSPQVLLDENYLFYRRFLESEDFDNIVFSMDTPGELDDYVLKADRLRLKQVLNNLLSNAFKFTDSGEVKLGAQMINEDKLKVYVKDSGVGISLEKQDVIFERFRQSDEGLARKFEGAGLGLSISKALVELMDGEIGLESEEGKGSVFYFTLPVYKKDKSKASYIKGAELHWQDYHFLVGFEDQKLQKKVKDALHSTEANVTFSDTREITLALAQKNHHFQMLITEVDSESLNCTDFLRKLKKEKPDIKILGLSSTDEEGREKCLEAGFTEITSPEITKEDLLKIINRLLE